jgi:asparagine synthase (glutamine-hydrolysing)
MCGIAGIFIFNWAQTLDRELLTRMCDCMIHRGPDEEGFFIDETQKVGLGHRRLSIIDLATGKQPMSDREGRIWLVFNGEIYNFRELRKELEQRGHIFQTKSDTEVIIYMYKEYGETAFARLNGIFAFAIYDQQKRVLILARDHFGVKPVYYTINNEKLLFGSEIKAIFQDPSIGKELDYEALHSFLTFRYNPSPQTLFKNIKKLSPGHYLKLDFQGNLELKSYWDYIPIPHTKISEAEAILEYQNLLENAIRRQMISDVPVGLLLSGGIDSAVVGYLMQKEASGKIKTFTIGFEGKGDYNELHEARCTAELINSEHYEICLSQKEYLNFFPRSFYYLEEPFAVTSTTALYYVSRLAAAHLKVVLTGQGADELLAGYARYFGEYYLSKYARFLRLLPFLTLVQVLPRNERLKRAAFAYQFENDLERFLAIYTIFTPAQKEQLFNEETKKKIINVDLKLIEQLYKPTFHLKDSLAKILYIDTRMSLADNLLLLGDKMSMANSLELRVPFLDVELVKFLESLPSTLKLRGKTHKYLHKIAIKKWLPDEIILRKKQGFATPMDSWLQNNLAVTAKKIFNSKDSACSNYFNMAYINLLIDQHQRRKQNYQRQIFALLSFELWHKAFFENRILDFEEIVPVKKLNNLS